MPSEDVATPVSAPVLPGVTPRAAPKARVKCTGAGRAFDTEKTYAGRIASYLSQCLGQRREVVEPESGAADGDDAAA